MIDPQKLYGPGKPLPFRIGPPCCYREKPDAGIVLMLGNMAFAFLLFLAAGGAAEAGHEGVAAGLFLVSVLLFFVGTPLINRIHGRRK